MIDEQEYIEHVGIIGMKWGTKNGGKRTNSLNKKVDRSIRKFDYGRGVPANTFKEQSRVARTLSYDNNKRIARMNKYLNKAAKQPTDKVISRWGKTPEKVAKVKDWLASNETQKIKLSEIRSKLLDVKMDTLR